MVKDKDTSASVSILARKDSPANEHERFASMDPIDVAHIFSASADIALVINAEGIISERVITSPDTQANLFIGWPGKAWADVVTVESRAKVKQIMQDLALDLPPRWRQLNHPVPNGRDIPVRYMAIKVGRKGHFVAVGRDLTPVAEMQQKLVAAELSIEQEHARLRNAEMRYRLLMQITSDGILVVDGRTSRILEANPASATILSRTQKRLVGTDLVDAFDSDDVKVVDGLIRTLRSAGRADDVALKLSGGQTQAVASGTVYRQDNASYYVIRLIPLAVGGTGKVVSKTQSVALELMDAMPDAFVITDDSRKIMSVNSAFLDMAQLGAEEQARGEPLDRWLGRVGVDTNLLFSSLRDKGVIRQVSTVMRGQLGTTDDVDVSGVQLGERDDSYYGFSIRRAARQAMVEEQSEKTLLRSVDEMTKLVGKVPLKDLVRETTDIIERLCIEAALKLNDNNRASSADMLGLSRQSLYVKLHRHGIEDKFSSDRDDDA